LASKAEADPSSSSHGRPSPDGRHDDWLLARGFMKGLGKVLAKNGGKIPFGFPRNHPGIGDDGVF
jgi:hypothetical protein